MQGLPRNFLHVKDSSEAVKNTKTLSCGCRSTTIRKKYAHAECAISIRKVAKQPQWLNTKNINIMKSFPAEVPLMIGFFEIGLGFSLGFAKSQLRRVLRLFFLLQVSSSEELIHILVPNSFFSIMDPFSALSLAGNIIQFIDFGGCLLGSARQLYKSPVGSLAVSRTKSFSSRLILRLLLKRYDSQCA